MVIKDTHKGAHPSDQSEGGHLSDAEIKERGHRFYEDAYKHPGEAIRDRKDGYVKLTVKDLTGDDGKPLSDADQQKIVNQALAEQDIYLKTKSATETRAIIHKDQDGSVWVDGDHARGAVKGALHKATEATGDAAYATYYHGTSVPRYIGHAISEKLGLDESQEGWGVEAVKPIEARPPEVHAEAWHNTAGEWANNEKQTRQRIENADKGLADQTYGTASPQESAAIRALERMHLVDQMANKDNPNLHDKNEVDAQRLEAAKILHETRWGSPGTYGPDGRLLPGEKMITDQEWDAANNNPAALDQLVRSKLKELQAQPRSEWNQYKYRHSGLD